MAKGRIVGHAPILLVRDVVRSAEYWCHKVGFSFPRFWGEPPAFAIVQRGDVTLGLNRMDAPGPWPKESWAAYLYVSDVDALHGEFVSLDIPAITAPRDQPYGCRDFEIEDRDGYRIAFGQDIATEDGLPGLGPERGRG